jgi:hypothetical protein
VTGQAVQERGRAAAPGAPLVGGLPKKNLFDLLFMAPSFQSAEPPQYPGRFTFKKEVQILFQKFETKVVRFG